MGASSGMGHEVALLLLKKGWALGLAARRLEPLQRLQAEYPDRVRVAQIDVTATDAPALLHRLFKEMGGADLYFHASGVGYVNKNLDSDKEMLTVSTNADGFVRCIGTAFRWFAEQGSGHIAAISSIAGTKGLGPAPAYSATKALQATYLQALDQLAHSRKLNIRITDIRPGFVRTSLLGDHPDIFPLLMDPHRVAEGIVRAVEQRRHIRIIDFRWHVITFLWRLVPNFIWRRRRLM